MRIEVIDNKTYVAAGKVYEIGDEVELTEEESAQLAEIRALEEKILSVRQEVVNVCHLADKNFVPELGEKAHELSDLGIEYSYHISKFLSNFQKRVGGMLPITFKEGKTGLVVRERTNDGGPEDVNYTVASVKRSIGMSRLDDQRDLAVALAGGDKRRVKIDLSVNDSLKFQPVEFEAGHLDADVLAGVLEEVLKDKRFFSDTLIMLSNVEGEDSCRGAVINVGLNSPNPKANRDRWEGFGKYAAVKKPAVVAVVSRATEKGAEDKTVEKIVLSFLSDTEKKILPFVIDRGPDGIPTYLRQEWVPGFEGPGGEVRYAGFISHK